MISFKGETYNDDRLFLLYVCPATTSFLAGSHHTTIYHTSPPPEAEWAVITYRNTPEHRAEAVHLFASQQEAELYRQYAEPTTPLISLGGRSPDHSIPYAQWEAWKRTNGFRDYNFRDHFMPGGLRPHEIIITRDPPPRPKRSER